MPTLYRARCVNFQREADLLRVSLHDVILTPVDGGDEVIVSEDDFALRYKVSDTFPYYEKK